MSDKLYRLIPEEGKHLADSRDTEGAVRGVYLDDETNKPCGAGEFIPVDEDESDEVSDFDNTGFDSETALAYGAVLAAGIAIGVVAKAAYPHVKKWVTTTAIPGIQKFWHQVTKKELKQEPAPADNTPEAIIDFGEPIEFSQDIDIVLSAYQDNTTSEEAQQHLLNIMCAAMYIASEIRKLSNTAIKDSERLEWKATLEKLATQSVTDGINHALAGNILRLEDSQVKQLSTYLGDTLISDGIFLPIKNERIKEALMVSSTNE